MHPVLFEIPGTGWPLRTFGVLVAAGFLLGMWIWDKLLRRHGDDPENDPARGSAVAMWVLVGVLGGARLMYVAVESVRYLTAGTSAAMDAYLSAENRGAAAAKLIADAPDDYERARLLSVGYDFVHDPIQILFVHNGGLVMFGGMFGAMLLGYLASKRTGLKPLNALDTGVTAGFFGQAVGRWGCLMVGDDFGSVVPEAFRGWPFPFTIEVPSVAWLQANPESLFPHDLAGETLWCTQIWMSANAAVIGLVGLWLLKRRSWHGQVASWILVHYCATRFLIEMFRGDEVRGVWLGGLATSQLVAIPGVLIGLWLLWRGRGKSRTEVAG